MKRHQGRDIWEETPASKDLEGDIWGLSAPSGGLWGSLWRSLGSLGPPGCIWLNLFDFSLSFATILYDGNATATRREPREPWKWCQERWLGPHLPRTPGARMTVVTQTPSNEKVPYGAL